MGKTKNVLVGAAGILSLGLLSACSGGGEGDGGQDSVTLTYASFLTESASHSQAFESWAEAVTEKTDGAVTFDSSYNGALCGAGEIASCVANGTADIGFSSTGYEVTTFPVSSLALTGYMTDDLHAAGEAFGALYEESDVIRNEWEQAGVRPLYNSMPGPNVVGISGEIDDLSDLQNMSLRASGDAGIALQLFGVNPVSMSLAESYEGIERGVVDGISTSVEGFVDARLFEVAPNVYNVGAYAGNGQMFHTMISQSAWDSLDPEVQDIMTEAAQDLEDRFMDEFYQPLAEEQCQVLADAGASVHEIGPESEGEAWATEAQALQVDDWLKRNPGLDDAQGLFNRYEELVGELEKEGTFSQEAACIEITAAA